MPWPQRIPSDIKRELDLLNESRDPPTSQDTWGAIREWLIKHCIEAPDGLPVEGEISTQHEI